MSRGSSRRGMLNGGTGGAKRNVTAKSPGSIRRPKSPTIPNVSPAKPPTGGGRAAGTSHGQGFAKRSTPPGMRPGKMPRPPAQAPGVAAPKRSI